MAPTSGHDRQEFYHGLNHLADTDVIRLLHLWPGSRGTPIECSLKHCKLSENSGYEALSYMWGGNDDHRINVNGYTFFVRRNLVLALDYLRYEKGKRTLWIDAICINQSNTNERNHQVSQMGQIYMNARRVVVWIGMPDPWSSSAIKFLAKNGKDGDMTERYQTMAMHRSHTSIDLNTLSAIHVFCTRQYWSRLWIIQEVILAADIRIQCGDDTCDWNDLAFFFRQLQEEFLVCRKVTSSAKLLEEGGSNVGPNDLLFSQKSLALRNSTPGRLIRERDKIKSYLLRGEELEDSFRPLLHLCLDYSGADCVEPRDKIFGLHSFASKCCRDAAPIDYSLSLFQIATSLLAHHMSSHKSSNMDIMSESEKFHQCLQLTQGYLKNSGWPWMVWPRAIWAPCGYSVRTPGLAQGRITHISSTIRSLRYRVQPKILATSAFNRMYLYSIANALCNDTDHSETFIRQLDLVIQRRKSIFCRIKLGSGKIPTSADAGNLVADKTSTVQVDQKSDFVVNQNLTKLWSYARRLRVKYEARDCRIALGEKGQIFFAPINAQVGDLICQFESSNALLLVRLPTKNQAIDPIVSLVGRGVDISACIKNDLTKPVVHGLSTDSMTSWHMDQSERIEMEFDIYTLHILTCSSSYPNPQQAKRNYMLEDQEIFTP